MSNDLILACGFCVALSALGLTAQAQTTTDGAAEQTAPAPQQNEQTRSDPFSPETIFEQTPQTDGPAARRRFVPAAARPAQLPELTLRGIGRTGGENSPTVLLEVEGHGMFVVREGDTISLQALPAENVIRIKEITDISVIVETGSFGELIILR